MKLRNKKTGKIYTLSDDLYIEYTQGGKIELRAIIPGGNMSYYYDSLDKLYYEWEDYKPTEPLIKDEKIRKAVRAWSEAEGIEEVAVMCHLVWGEKMTEIVRISNAKQEITFKGDLEIKTGNYTIAELCGEEQECES